MDIEEEIFLLLRDLPLPQRYLQPRASESPSLHHDESCDGESSHGADPEFTLSDVTSSRAQIPTAHVTPQTASRGTGGTRGQPSNAFDMRSVEAAVKESYRVPMLDPDVTPTSDVTTGRVTHDCVGDVFGRAVEEEYSALPAGGAGSLPRSHVALYQPITLRNRRSLEVAQPPPGGVLPGRRSDPVGGHAFTPDTGDLSSWQRRHQENLRRQQLESAQLSQAGRQQASLSQLIAGDPHRLDGLRVAADSIITEKDAIIDKQRQRLMDLEQMLREKDLTSQVQKGQLYRARDVSQYSAMQLCEMQEENMHIRLSAKDSIAASKCYSLESLEQKLGKAEYEVDCLKAKMLKEVKVRDDRISDLEAEIAKVKEDMDNVIVEKKQAEGCAARLEAKIQSIDRYLADLPSADESAERDRRLKERSTLLESARAHNKDVERRLLEMTRALQSRDEQVNNLQDTERSLRTDIKKQETEIVTLTAQLKDARMRNGLDEADRAQRDIGRLEEDLDKAKRVLDKKQQQMSQMEDRFQIQSRDLAARVKHEQDTVRSLREEVKVNDEQLRKLRATVKQLREKQQADADTAIKRDERIAVLERMRSGDQGRLEHRLVKDLMSCVHELKTLVEFCVQKSEGREPNISVLLGVNTAEVPASPEAGSQDGDSVQSLKNRSSQVRDLRRQIDRMRELLSAQLAQDMGDNITCAQQ